MNPRSSYSMALAAHDISEAMGKLINLQLERHSWLIRAGEQIRETNKTERAKEANDERTYVEGAGRRTIRD